ncbi:MAG: DEAD/DEAH box helicase [Flavobacteriales bacterium]|nr:DEAD/DEAH box helicase [Flavobacteriales bacterium]
MQLTENAKVEFIFAVVRNQFLGLIIEPYLVEVTPAGNYSLAHQRLMVSNIKLYKDLLTENDVQSIRILETFTPENIVKKYYKKSAIRPKEYFERKCDKNFFEQTIRPFIERRIVEAMDFINKDRIFYSGDSKNPSSIKLKYLSNEVGVLFHFVKNQEETRYYITLKYEEQRLKIVGNGAILIYSPAYLILGESLIHLPELDGKKLEPFLTKYYISIAPKAEKIFFDKFGLELIEKFNIRTDGIEIKQETHQGKAILKLEGGMHGKPWFVLNFRYNTSIFPYHSKKKAHAYYEYSGENMVIHKIRRSKSWEEHKKEFIISLGLSQKEGSVFQVDPDRFNSIEKEEPYKSIEWLERNYEALFGRDVEIEQNLSHEYFLGKKDMKIEVNKNGDWFDLQTRIWFGEFEFSFLDLKDNILNNDRNFLLPNGKIALIPEEWMAKFQSLTRFNEGKEHIRIKKHHLGMLGNLPKTGIIQSKLEGLKDFETIKEKQLPVNFKGRLRPYQIAGYNWFYFLQEFNFGGCLADDMGLGKTIQTLALLQNEKEINSIQKPQIDEHLSVKKTGGQLSIFDAVQAENGFTSKSKTSLLIVPTSLIYTWRSEAAKFTPSLKIFVHSGPGRPKNSLHFRNYDLIISTYGTMRNDESFVKDFHFHYIILDESQNIKNPKSKVSRSIRNLQSTYKLALTGTPVENSVMDLWSQMSFVNKGLLGGLKFFEENYVLPIEKNSDTEKLEELKGIIKPFLLRRTKSQVATELPEKTEQILYCDMSPEQEILYEETKSKFRNEILESIENDGLQKSRFNIIAGLTKLRQIANHPKLTNPEYTGQSGKFDELIEKTVTVVNSGHKILIYSQFVKQLSLFKEAFLKLKIRHCYFDGSYSSKQRQEQVKLFQGSVDIPVFLVSLKAGGVGLTLTAADYVFIVDPWWNPSVERQAVDRTHRIGQTKNVFSYKFITRNTVEEKILHLQNKKLNMASELVLAEDSFYKTLDVNDIKKILS